MRDLVISDMHLGHGNIILYTKRPQLQDSDWTETKGERPKWVSPEIKKARTNEMNEFLVRNWNSVVTPEDTVKHLGDFFFDNGDGKDAMYWESRLNGKIIHLKGNHDRSKKIKGMLNAATVKVAGHEILLQHRPPAMELEIPDFCDVVLCGHVHGAWDHKWEGSKLVVNMSVEVRDYKPMSMDRVIGEIERLQRIGPCIDNE